MAANPLPSPLTIDLPTNWTRGQIVAPTGQEVGLPTNYGYNYLMEKVNEARTAINTINSAQSNKADLDESGKVPASQLPNTGEIIFDSSISIPQSGWNEDPSNPEFGYYVVVNCPGALEEYSATITIDNMHLTAAFSCGLSPTVQVIDNGVKFWSRSAPTEDIPCSIAFFSGGSLFGRAMYVDSPNDYNPYQNLNGKQVSIIGDSISTFEGYLPPGYPSFYPREGYDIVDVTQTWWKKLLETTGMVLANNCSYSGSTVTGNSLGNASVGCSNARVSDVSLGGKYPDIIIIMMGINDFNANVPVGDFDGTSIPADGTITTFSEAYALLVYKLMNSYPRAEIFVSTILENANAKVDEKNLFSYNSAIRNIANIFGCKIMNMHACGITGYNLNYYLADGTHPKISGATLLAKQSVTDVFAKSTYMHLVPGEENDPDPDPPSQVLLCGNLDFEGSSNEYVQTGSTPVPVMVGYNRELKTTDLSGHTITQIKVRVSGNGEITVGTCDLTNADAGTGISATFATKSTYQISGVASAGDFATIECNIVCGPNQTLAIQDKTDTALCALSYAGKSGMTLEYVQGFRVCPALSFGTFSDIGATSAICLLGGIWGTSS